MHNLTPGFGEFKKLSAKYNVIPVYAELLADLETPVSCYLKVADSPNSFLLESVDGGEKIARFSFIGVSASMVFQSKGKEIQIFEFGKTNTFETKRTPLDELERIMKDISQAPTHGLPPFSGGAVGYMGYDMIRFFETIPDKNPDVYKIPDSYFMFTDVFIAFDHIQRKIKIICNARVAKPSEAKSVYAQSLKKINEIINLLSKKTKGTSLLSVIDSAGTRPIKSNMSKKDFCKAVLAAKEHIKAGDIFQVVLSQAFSARVKAKPFDFYRCLRSINPSPYMFYLNLKGFQLVGSSPEVHVRCENGKAALRPIAGTRKRGAGDAEDLRLEKELLADTKERAEHLMLVDLGRNDLGRVCEFNSIRVPEFMTIERYSHVMHIVSLVEGTLKKDKSVFDLLKNTFPAGTVSGAPKVRAMEIIDSLENQKRGFYSGIVGYFSYSGNLDSCIAIRTILVRDGVATVQAGAGIVADSLPEMEYQETVNKAQALIKAIEVAEKV